MIFKFGDFQFNNETNILTKDGQIIHLNEKPARLLSLFLEEPDKIHSKADILDNVWPNRVLTEQVIFQNISYLRAKFGDLSIKTFSRKGYQWQLPLTVVDNSENQPNNESSSANTDDSTSTKANRDTIRLNRKRRHYILGFSILLSTLALWLAISTLYLQPEKSLENSVVKLASGDKSNPLNSFKDLQLNVQKLFDSPYSSWSKYATSRTHWLIGTKLYKLEHNVALRFHIQGANRGWHGYFLATNLNEAFDKLNHLSATLSSTKYFTIESTYAALAELTVIADEIPDNSLISHQIINLNYQLDNLDRANILADQALAEHAENLDKGLIYLLKAQVNLWNQNDKAAEENIKKALSIFKIFNLPHLEAQALIELSWVSLARREFREGVNLLNQAASKARLANEPLLEFEAHIVQSFMASKSGQVELSHAKLGLAKELLSLHNLDEIHKVRIHNNSSWLAETPEDKFNHNKNLLKLPFSPEYEKFFYVAAETVRDHYIQSKNWNKAKETLKPWQRDSFHSLSRAHIAFAKKEWDKGIREAKNAFQFARVHHHKIDALDAALLLLENQMYEGTLLEVADYEYFIQHYATNRWLSQNKKSLQKIAKGNQK